MNNRQTVVLIGFLGLLSARTAAAFEEPPHPPHNFFQDAPHVLEPIFKDAELSRVPSLAPVSPPPTPLPRTIFDVFRPTQIDRSTVPNIGGPGGGFHR